VRSFISTNIVRVVKSRRMRCANHVVCMGEMRSEYKILSQNTKGRDHSEVLGVGGRIILKYILGN